MLRWSWSKQLLGLHIALFFSSIACAATPLAERDALVALYNTTSGDTWQNNEGWLGAEGTECSWFGITCSEDGHVTEVVLRGNLLKGEFPESITHLNQLQTLDFQVNDLTGIIPQNLANLTQLTYLNLSHLKLGGNSFTENTLPSGLGHLTNLQELRLISSQLTGSIPKELGNLSQLKYLDLQRNKLSGSIPIELANLSQLEDLNLSQNELSGRIPTELSHLNQLKSLSLENNNLSGSIPVELANLNSLERLELSLNPLGGTIPKQLSKLSQLKRLRLLDTQLSGEIPAELALLSNLSYLNLANNSLSGTIPKELGQLTKLTWLSLYTNQLSGIIPHELGALSKLIVLQLSKNQLTGKIPKKFEQLSNLKILGLSNNLLSGTIPTEPEALGGLLSTLTLNENCFSFGSYDFLPALEPVKSLDLGEQDACQDKQGNIPILKTAKDFEIHIPALIVDNQAYRVTLERFHLTGYQGDNTHWQVKEIKLLGSGTELTAPSTVEYNPETATLAFYKVHLRDQVTSATLFSYTPPDYAEEGFYFAYIPE